ncbi:MAG: D-aminoacyl-tRNA deacylase, partial [Reichenbachiella sp.]
MITVLQRTSEASVKINQKVVGKIGAGLMVLLGIEEEDDQQDIDWLAKKITNLRIFDDENGVMN